MYTLKKELETNKRHMLPLGVLLGVKRTYFGV